MIPGPHRRRHSVCFLAILFVLLTLAGCATKPKQPDTDKPVITKEQRKKQDSLLVQLETSLAEENTARAKRLIAQLKTNILNNEQKIRRQIAIAQYYILTNNPRMAIPIMQAVDDPFLATIKRELQIKWFFTYADVLDANDDRRGAIRMRLLTDERLSLGESAPNHRQLRALAENIDIRELLKEAGRAPDLYMRGWYDFFILKHLAPRYGRDNVRELWQKTYHRHPANRYLARTPKQLPGNPKEQITRVAFLLPFSGILAPYSEAVLRGYSDAAAENDPTILANRYDTESEVSINTLARQIRGDNNQAIIGPLRPQMIDRFAAANIDETSPVFLLNELPVRMRHRKNIHSLASTVEKSIAFAAGMAYDDGCRHNLLIAEDTILGDRMRAALQDEWSLQPDVTRVKDITLSEDTPINQQISDFLEVNNAEVAATKDIYRRYLLILSRIGENEQKLDNAIPEHRGDVVRIPNILPVESKKLLLSKTEIAFLAREYYAKNELALKKENKNAKNADTAEIEKTDEYYSKLTPAELLNEFTHKMENSYDRVAAECIFLATDRATATKIRPYLSFYLANDMRVYGTFLLYDSRPGSSLYEDLNQVYYGEMPGVTEALDEIKTKGGDTSKLPAKDAYGLRFYALGRDLFSIVKAQNQLSSQKPADQQPIHIMGESGILTLDGQNINFLVRPSVFVHGTPVARPGKSVFQ